MDLCNIIMVIFLALAAITFLGAFIADYVGKEHLAGVLLHFVVGFLCSGFVVLLLGLVTAAILGE